MSSILNTTTQVQTRTSIPRHISKTAALSLLHTPTSMLTLNPLFKSYEQLSVPRATSFFKSVSKENKPSSESSLSLIPVFAVIEASSPPSASTTENESEEGGSWRGGWASRFIPDEITYETSLESRPDGMRSVTHAPMGVHSVTTWVIKEEGEGLVMENTGRVTSNRMLMTFIRTTLQESYDKLARDFMVELERRAAEMGTGGKAGDVTEKVDEAGKVAGERSAEIEVTA